jgi:LysM repeat protein
MKVVSYNSLVDVTKQRIAIDRNGDEVFKKTLKKFEEVAFADGKANDPLKRWEQIKRGLHAIRSKRSHSTNKTHTIATHEKGVKSVSENYTPIQKAALEVAKHDLVNRVRDHKVLSRTIEHKKHHHGSGEIDPVKHWLMIKSGMRAGQLNRVKIKVHMVRSGESLEEIAEKYAGDRKLAGIIAKYNNLPRNGKIEVGTFIKIPTGGIIDRLSAFRG